MLRLLKATLKAAKQSAYFRRGREFSRRFKDAAAPRPQASRPNPLEQYFDAVGEGPGIWKWRHYFDIYHRHFQRFVGQDVVIVEVGIYSGGSLRMWRHYFGEQAKIIGVDIEPACRQYAASGVEVHIGDQGDRGFWREFCAKVPRFDIVIDDGGHKPAQQIATLESLLPHLAAGGIYLCEDIHGELNRFGGYVGGLVQGLNHFTSDRSIPSQAIVASPIQRAIGSVHVYPFCLVVEKHNSPVERFVGQKHGTQWQPFL